MKLYFDPHSRSQVAKWMLDEAGVDYEIVTTLLKDKAHKKPDYLKINPAGKLPALVDGRTRVFENAAICLYVAEKFPHKRLAPPVGSPERGRYLSLMVYSTAQLEPAMGDSLMKVRSNNSARLDRLRARQGRGGARAGRGALPVRRAVHRGGRDDRLDVHLAARLRRALEPPEDRRLHQPSAGPAQGHEVRLNSAAACRAGDRRGSGHAL
jgi:glutathione S-transferase